MPTILVIDDEIPVRTVLSEMLRREGYEVRDAAEGAEGIAVLKREPVDLVVTDIIMPGKEGIETIVELKRDYPGLKIIAISGGGRLAPENYLKMASDLGVDRCFSKPFRRAELLEAVRELLPPDEPPAS